MVNRITTTQDGHRYVFIFDDANAMRTAKHISRSTGTDDLPLDWSQSNALIQRARRIAELSESTQREEKVT